MAPSHRASTFHGRNGEERGAANPWTDCRCGWRNYREPQAANPVNVTADFRATWIEPERCRSCRDELEEKQAA
jgi:hypothetical protein